MRQLLVIVRTVWGPEVPNYKGLWCHCPMYNVFCILYVLQKMSLFFIKKENIQILGVQIGTCPGNKLSTSIDEFSQIIQLCK